VGNAQQVQVLADEDYFIGQQTQVFHAPEGVRMSLEEVQQQEIQNQFVPSEQEQLNTGYVPNEVWVKFELAYRAGERFRYLFLDAAIVDEIDFFWRSDKDTTWKKRETGRVRPYKSRGKIDHVGFALPLDFREVSTYEVYIRSKNSGPILLPMRLQTDAAHHNYTRHQHIYYGLYFGVLLVMLLYNLFIYFSLKDKNYLLYSLVVLCTLLIFSSVSGYLGKYFYRDLPWLNIYMTKGTMAILCLVLNFFTRSFLGTYKINRWLDRWLLALAGLAVVAFVLVVTDLSYKLSNTVTSLTAFSQLVAGVWAWRRGVPAAKFYTIAWVSYIFGGLLATLRNSGTLPMNAITTHGAEIGSGVEVVLISLALAERYRQYRKEKEAATKRALEIQEEANKNLDRKVKERTVELQEANEELNQVNEELHTTLETVQEQSQKISHINQEISAGINYAKRIQDSMLPKEEDIQALFQEAFVLFLPRDVVSGDFYFALAQGNLTFIAAVDCTGHGVPGGFMSMVGMNLLQEIIKERKVYNSGEILDELHLGVQRSLRQKETQNRDGMDTALCVLDQKAQTLQYSGAKNPLLAVQQKEMLYLKGTRQSIGGFQDLKPFEVHTIALDGEGFFFLYSDGFQDQFGGEEKRKFMSKRFRKLLLSLASQETVTIKEALWEKIETWRKAGEEPQTDDVLVLGFKA